MKIEIGESIVYSWLRHIKKCQVVQLNWKISPEWEQVSTFNNNLQALMNKANTEFDNPFKKTNNLRQLFRQAEIDAIGINISQNTIYATDIAFHENGLSYGDKFETAKRITKKIIRTILLLQHYFKDIGNHNIVFISPKINPEPLSVLESALSKISTFLKAESISCEIELISNEKFQNEILNPITDLSKNVADTSELFLRSIQLVNIFHKTQNEQKRVIVHQPRKNEDICHPSRNSETERDIEIKKVQKRVPRWFKRPHQINSTILLSFLELSEQFDDVTVEMLRDKCRNISDFEGNFNQMKNFGEKNHGKVFELKSGKIYLWKPVEQFILDKYNKVYASK